MYFWSTHLNVSSVDCFTGHRGSVLVCLNASQLLHHATSICYEPKKKKLFVELVSNDPLACSSTFSNNSVHYRNLPFSDSRSSPESLQRRHSFRRFKLKASENCRRHRSCILPWSTPIRLPLSFSKSGIWFHIQTVEVSRVKELDENEKAWGRSLLHVFFRQSYRNLAVLRCDGLLGLLEYLKFSK